MIIPSIHSRQRMSFLRASILLLSLTSVCANFFGGNASLVVTKYGILRGFKYVTDKNTTSDIFLNIPYARPPLGNLRFEVRKSFLVYPHDFVMYLQILRLLPLDCVSNLSRNPFHQNPGLYATRQNGALLVLRPPCESPISAPTVKIA